MRTLPDLCNPPSPKKPPASLIKRRRPRLKPSPAHAQRKGGCDGVNDAGGCLDGVDDAGGYRDRVDDAGGYRDGVDDAGGYRTVLHRSFAWGVGRVCLQDRSWEDCQISAMDSVRVRLCLVVCRPWRWDVELPKSSRLRPISRWAHPHPHSQASSRRLGCS